MPLAHPLPPLDASTALTAWRFDPVMVAVALALTVGYAVGVVRARARGGSWSVGRSALFVLVGVGSLVVATTSCLAVYRSVLFWPAAVGNTLLAVLVPIGLALGDPVGLARRAWPRAATPPAGHPGRRLLRLVTFPLVTVVAGVVSPVLLYFTPYFVASLRSGAVRELSWAQMLVTGLVFVLPLMSEDLLPPWCTWPVRAVIAFVDGLADALPGLFVATSGSVITGTWYAEHPRTWGPSVLWDQTIGGTLMLTISEAVGVPLLVAVFVAWSRADAVTAREVDRRLDAEQPRRTPPGAASPDVPDAAGASEELMRPWWETEGGPLGDRFRGS